jgi:MFS family permease
LFLFKEFTIGKQKIDIGENWILGNETIIKQRHFDYENKKVNYLECVFMFNFTCTKIMEIEGQEVLVMLNNKFNSSFKNLDDFFADSFDKIKQGKEDIRKYKIMMSGYQLKINYYNEIIWGFINSLFLTGYLAGALIFKRIYKHFNTSVLVLVNNFLNIVGSVFVFISPYVQSPVCFICGRFLFGIQGGMTTIMIYFYLRNMVRGSYRKFMPQIFSAFGLLISQILGLNELLDSDLYWNFLQSFSCAPAFLTSMVHLFFMLCKPQKKNISHSNTNSEESSQSNILFSYFVLIENLTFFLYFVNRNLK